MPFTDPMADGVTIQRSSQRRAGAGREPALDSRRARVDAEARHAAAADELSEPAARRSGSTSSRRRAARVGVCGFIVPDLPVDESDEMRAALEARRCGAGSDGDAGHGARASQAYLRSQPGLRLRRHDDRHHGQERRRAGRHARLSRSRALTLEGAGVRGLRHSRPRAGGAPERPRGWRGRRLRARRSDRTGRRPDGVAARL